MKPPRRVITGLDADGRSCFLFDGPSPMVVWQTDAALADNGTRHDAGGGTFRFPDSGTLFCFSDFAPGRGTATHASDTLDYIVVVSGEVIFVTETGETLLRACNVLVDRGNMHNWRNDGPEACHIMNVLTPARRSSPARRTSLRSRR